MLGRKTFRRLATGLFVVLAVPLLAANAASAQYVGVPPPNVGATDRGPVVLGAQFRAQQVGAARTVEVRAQGRALAVTGGDLLAIVGIAAGAVLAGIVLVRVGRRTRPADAA